MVFQRVYTTKHAGGKDLSLFSVYIRLDSIHTTVRLVIFQG